MGIRNNVADGFKISLLASVLVTTLVGCGSDSESEPEDNSIIPQANPITSNEEYDTLRYVYAMADPAFVELEFWSLWEPLRTFHQEMFPVGSSTPCTLEKCTADDIESAEIAVCEGEGQTAIKYTYTEYAGNAYEYNNCSVDGGSEVLNGTIIVRYLDAISNSMELIYDDFSIVSDGDKNGIDGRILAPESAVSNTKMKSSESLKITKGDDIFMITGYEAMISVDGARFSETVSMSVGDESREMFTVTSPTDITGAAPGIVADGGTILFKQAAQEMSIELAPGGDLTQMFITIDGENQTISKEDFDAPSLFSLVF